MIRSRSLNHEYEQIALFPVNLVVLLCFFSYLSLRICYETELAVGTSYMTVQNVWNVSKKIKVSKTSQLSRQLTRVIEASVGGREPIIFNTFQVTNRAEGDQGAE